MSNNFLSVLSPNNWPFDLAWLPEPAYLVGGAVRDALLGRVSEYLDLDFVMMSPAVKTARKIAAEYQAGFVLLDAERQIARVVFAGATADFAQADGDNLEADLGRRDFRLNAIAYNPFTEEIIDPLEGEADLQARIIRMISPANLRDDPLRLLRAYRQAAQLDFAIAPETHSTIRELAPLLNQVAVERVRSELGYLLNNSQGIPWICRAWEDNLISVYFPSVQDKFDRLTGIPAAIITLAEIWSDLPDRLSQWVRDTIKTPLLAIAKLACLVNPDPIVAEFELTILKYSNAEIKSVIALLKYLPKVTENTTSELSLKEQYFLFRDLGNVFPAFAIFALSSEGSFDRILTLINRYLDPEDQVSHPTQLVSGNDLMAELNLPRSPLIGQLLLEIQLARIEGRISTRQEALELATKLVGNVL
ncbi:[cytidine(C)-cytidine(C)-adenosine (A)]-adding enzyme [Oscillatoriales cyanobacterium USR001]|nr:[cytidine(C)-cytidine(C)-adenosine (A)]-adding enzyme [Oscillatoriales cyanobacterium USR001]